MMKATWTKPQAMVEQFMANEYIAKCTDLKNTYYAFKCDAGETSRWQTIYHDVYYEQNNVAGLQTSGWSRDYHRTSRFHPCGVEHYAEAGATSFIDGYLIMPSTDEVVNVVIWTGENNDNVHCTKALKEDIKIIQGNKS